MKGSFRIFLLFLGFLSTVCSCKKTNNGSPNPQAAYSLNYGDSVFYLKTSALDYIIAPTMPRTGQYVGFPAGIDIDQNSGAINISKCETGLRYRVTFFPTGSTDSFNTIILISGINFLDGFYKLTTADSLARPIYNGNLSNSIPSLNKGTLFDDGSNCNKNGCVVNTVNGVINLAQTVRNGVFGTVPKNNERHEYDMNYRIDDKSAKSLNTIRVKLYYFDTITNVTQEVYDIIASRQGSLLGHAPAPTPFHNMTSVNGISQTTGSSAPPPKPRPPCIFVLAR